MGCCNLANSTVYMGMEPGACTTEAACTDWDGVFTNSSCKFDSDCALGVCERIVPCCRDTGGGLTETAESVASCTGTPVSVSLVPGNTCAAAAAADFAGFFCCYDNATIMLTEDGLSVEDCAADSGVIVQDSASCECAGALPPAPPMPACLANGDCAPDECCVMEVCVPAVNACLKCPDDPGFGDCTEIGCNVALPCLTVNGTNILEELMEIAGNAPDP